MIYSISTIAQILHLPEPKIPASNVSILLTDSRSLTYPEDTLFFALRTSNNDGHRYLHDLYEGGVRNFVVDHIPATMQHVENTNFLVVSDVKKALQTIASYHRGRFTAPVVGVTGSRGKTVVKEWLYQLLCADYSMVRSPRSYNSQIGVPLSIWEMNEETQLAVFEAGISKPNEMAALQSMIRPKLAVITNIGDEHNEGFSDNRAKCEEKVTLCRDCDCIVYNGDDALISEVVANAGLTVKEIAWSRYDSDSPLFISSIKKDNNSTTIEYSYLKYDGVITIPFVSDYDVENAIHCLAVMLYLCRPFDVIASRMAMLSPVGTRLNVIEGVNNCLLIYDAYTSDFRSLAPALDFMQQRATKTHSTTVILSDVVHDAMGGEKLYKSIARLLRQKNITRVIGIGEEISSFSSLFGENATFYPSTSSFLSSTTMNDFRNELILIKGASHFHFESLSDVFEAKQHETVLEVNLDAVVHNYNFYRSKVKPTTGIVCMVKASGYGAGSFELAKTLQSQGAAYLAVAVLDEGVDLRKAGISMPIMVLNPKVGNYKTLFTYRLEPEIYSFDILDEIIREATKFGITNYPVHIKLDTGMHRLGFLEEDMPMLVEKLRNQNVIKPVSVFSHLATADCPDMDDYTLSQFNYFYRCCNVLQSGFEHHIKRHILNSTGITRFNEHQCDLVRLGICLYGIPTMNDGSQDALRQVSSLHSVIISIKEWEAGTTIGYSRRGVLSRKSRIATIPIGYADGIDRHLGNGNASFIVNGHRCPTVGNICMDICMIDVTDADCKVGDAVEIFGENITVMELAEHLGTIPYEILTSVSQRVKRVYYRE